MRGINTICLIILIGFAIWSGVLWHDGSREPAIYVLIWAMVLPAIVRSIPPSP